MKIIDKHYLRQNPKHVFVFGDNLLGKGYGGAAVLRDEPNSLGFVTKKAPTHNPSDSYTPEEYASKYEVEIKRLKKEIEKNPDKTFLISRLGAGLANKYHIWEKIIEPNIKRDLAAYSNIEYLW
jgi:hypothetical protein